ncbi:MAG: phage tail sheath subtilisin-like domain-containing protein [Proteobacteria bacterium]|nr:phage tail sheath subtilisin-like domain-containing protein [Pseudomonadota bacterium]
MRLSAEMRPPGVYPAVAEPTASKLEIADTRIVGFVGLTQKGPMDEPRRIANWDEFVETYGYTPQHYLSDTIEAFFRNGGTRCYVVRVAHCPRDGSLPAVEHAASAERIIHDDWQKPCLRVSALNEGLWGNDIWVKCVHATGAKTLLTRDLEVGAGEAHVSSTRGLQVGALVRIYDRENEDYVVLTEVGEKTVKWSAETPVNRKHRSAAPTHLEVLEFEIHATLRERREVFKALQMHPRSRNYAPRVIAAQSRLIRLDDLETRSPVPHNRPEPEPLARLEGGRDGTDHLTPEDFVGVDLGPAQRSGLMALVPMEEVALLASPDAMKFIDDEPGPAGEIKAQRVQDAMIDLCENLKDRFAILDCPQTRKIDDVKRWRRRTDSSYAAYYWPWLQVATHGGIVRPIPPSGIMAGVYALRDTEGGVHYAPGNVPISGVTDLALRVTEDHLGDLNAEGVNSFRVQRGVRPWGVRTASSDPDWRYINIRRLFIMLRRSLEAGMSWVPFESNDQKTWDTVHTLVSEFLEELFRQGMFAGGSPADSFYVKCDAEVNPPETVDRGYLICEIGVAPVHPAEFIIVHLTQNTGAS